MEKDDEEISIDFSKVKKWFKEKEGHNEEAAKPHEVEHKTEHEHHQVEHQSHEKSDDEISIDFGKIKNFFKSDEKKEPDGEKHESKDAKKDDDEISFDFGRIKRFFKSDDKESSPKEDELSVDWGKIVGFFKKYGIIFLILIPIILSIYVRMQSGLLPFADQWAASNVVNNLKSQIRSGIDQQYPNLPDANKNALADAELQKVISQSKAQLDEQIRQASAYFKSFFQA